MAYALEPTPARAALEADAAPDLSPGKSHYQLDDVAWGFIREAYQSGVTAKALSRTWRVAVPTIYGRASRHGWTKSSRASEVSRVMVRREQERRALTAQIEGLREQAAQACEPPPEADPAAAARTLVRRAAAQALGGRTEEALALVKLAEGLARADGALPPAPVDLWVDEPEEEEAGAPEDLQARRERLAQTAAVRFGRRAPGSAEADEAAAGKD